jgi:hypothetical protein
MTALVALIAAAPALGAEYGTIKGKFVFEGKSSANKIAPTKDAEFCSKHELVEEKLVVNDGALQNVFVFLSVPRGKKVEINPDIKPGEPKVLDNKGCRFEPHAMTLWTEEELHVKNSDPGLGHNTNAQNLVANTGFNETVPNDKPIVKKFSKSEPIPTQVSCSVHPWMNAVVLIRDNPYMAVSAKDGSFEIKGVPAGKQDFVFWHEAKGNLRDLQVGKSKADRKGQVSIDVPAGETVDLGEIKVPAKILGL